MSLSKDEILKIFKDSEALLEGHFILTSGLHSDKYFQCAKVFQFPWHSDRLTQETAKHFQNTEIDVVVSPAVGGIVFGQDVARNLGKRSIFTERKDGEMVLRRGFEVAPGEKCLVAEDVTTTGGSVKEVIAALKAQGAEIVAVTAVVDRSGGTIDFGVPYHALFQMDVQTHDPAACPLCASGSPAVKPGSRGLK